LITGLCTILADFQEGLAKTNPYAYKLVLSHKVTKRLIPLLPGYSNKLIPGGSLKILKIKKN
jgi:hypothetical protein